MKKILLAAAALSTLAAPAMAQTWQGRTYADGVATYDIKGQVPTFCKFGSQGNRAAGLENATDSERSISLAEGDRTFNITNLANPNDNTVQAAAGSFIFERMVCNVGYTVTARSTNGGLKHATISTAAAPFITTVPYNFNINIPGDQGTKPAAAGVAQMLADSGSAYAGAANFRFLLPARDSLLLRGDYQDTVVLTLTPKT
ncbi:hypothetical protein [Brevundimonas intermedia]|uniref:hypothetical protein n=1 Tax=Brevundimonas intermedia TaxID=74315 RepID=UPI00320B279E